METALEQLKNKIQEVVEQLKNPEVNTEEYGYKSAMQSVINDIDLQMLEIEKDQAQNIFIRTEQELKEIAWTAWKYAAHCHIMYPQNRHSFSKYWFDYGKADTFKKDK